MVSLLNYYKKKLEENENLDFLNKYLFVSSLARLNNIGYFCGMDYASKDIYSFSEYISRYDHSYTTALLTWKLTHDKKMTLSALFHDVATPCFSHVIDYMNKDYIYQESTEVYTHKVMTKDELLLCLLSQDGYNLKDISDFKKHSIVDLNRPKLCADRLDGIILTSIGWVENIDKSFIDEILDDITITKNEDGEAEISFKSKYVASNILKMNNDMDELCHSNNDCYMMDLLSKITKLAIKNDIISYEMLYYITEYELLNILNNCNNIEILKLLNRFYTIKKDEIKIMELPPIKKRVLNPLVNNSRIV